MATTQLVAVCLHSLVFWGQFLRDRHCELRCKRLLENKSVPLCSAARIPIGQSARHRAYPTPPRDAAAGSRTHGATNERGNAGSSQRKIEERNGSATLPRFSNRIECTAECVAACQISGALLAALPRMPRGFASWLAFRWVSALRGSCLSKNLQQRKTVAVLV